MVVVLLVFLSVLELLFLIINYLPQLFLIKVMIQFNIKKYKGFDMRKLLLSAVASSYLFSAGLGAATSIFDNSIQEIGLAYSKGKNKDNYVTGHFEYSLLLGAGLRFEYSKNISEHPEFSKSDISRYGLFAVYNIYLPGTGFSFTPKMGMVKTDGEFELYDTYKKIKSKKTTFTYGIEANYDLNDNAAVFVGYTDYGNNIEKAKDIKLKNLDSKNVSVGIKISL